MLALLIALCALLLVPAVGQADTVFGTTAPTQTSADNDGQPVELGMKFRASQNGFITSLRFYKQANNTGTHIGHLWSSTGTQLAEATFTNETASGWQQVELSSPVAVTAGTTYVVSSYSSAGFYAFTDGGFNTARTSGALTALANGTDGTNGVYRYGTSGFPTASYDASNYWVDVVFSLTATDTTAPTVASTSPTSGATNVPTTSTVTANFSEPMNASTITAANVTLTGPGGAAIAGSVSYNATSRAATFTPSATLAANTSYTATVKGGSTGVADTAGNRLAANATWTFQTGAAAGSCPCNIFGTSAPSGQAENDGQAVELGTKFRATESGFITGVRFYKQSNNTGTHTGHLWSSTGTQLAEVTFSGESASGWQQASFSSPVAVTAGTTYVISYYSSAGYYAFTANGLDNAVTNGPLTALADGTDGGNGVYRFGTSGFPTSTYNASNYWVDPVFERTVGTDTTPPTVSTIAPASGATGVATSTTVSATFSEAINPSTITTTNVRLTGPGGAGVAGTVAYNSTTRTATLTPSAALAANTSYTATVKGGTGGVADPSGNVMTADRTWTFQTAASQSDGCPCNIFGTTAPSDTQAGNDGPQVEVGVKFRSSTNGFITGVRFYKQSNNIGTHIGHLWSSAGTQLAEATFTGESASGWQEVLFSAPVAVTAGTTYVASYFSSSGYFATTLNYFTSATTNGMLTALANGTDGTNGVYRYGASGFPNASYAASNYWVDPIFRTTVGADSTPPSVSSTSPVSGATAVDVSSKVSATFNEPMNAATMTTTNVKLAGPGGAAVNGDVAYTSATRTVTFTPSAPLAPTTTYTATVKGGTGGVADSAGNVLAADKTWTFTTDAAGPSSPDQGPGGPVLVLATSADKFGSYYAEILRNEGLNEFTVSTASISAALLANYDVVVLAPRTLTAADVSALTTWVNAGGNLIAMRPDKQLASLLGLTDQGTTLSNTYLKVDTAQPAGAGIVNQTIQYHGTADRYGLNGATAVASLYTSSTVSTTSPAVSLRSVGSSGGQAAAFSFDLSRSVVQSRQGNPAWAGQERDGATGPIRPNDLFYPDWVDNSKWLIPQADEQQRVLANLITLMTLDRKPLPRFWYLPDSDKAAIVLTGDDHANGGTAGQFQRYENVSTPGCSVANWECIRSTSYLYPGSPLTNAQAAAFQTDGFEIALHVNTNCGNYTADTLATMFDQQLADFKSQWPSINSPKTERTHCVAWSDWASQPKVELANGIRLDTNYYQWGPDAWITGPGTMTGSNMPMRFTDTDGSMIDVYQATTQLPDEGKVGANLVSYADSLMDAALGTSAYYGVFTINAHTDQSDHPAADQIIADAQTRGVPVVSARQMLQWLDGRNSSSFGSVSYSGNTLSFTVTAGSGTHALTAMLPVTGPSGRTLSNLTRSGSSVTRTNRVIKGINYAMFTVTSGSYTATYS